MANRENRVISHIRAQMKSAHWLLEETMSDVSDEMARFAPPGKALPIGAAYVHLSPARTGWSTPSSRGSPR